MGTASLDTRRAHLMSKHGDILAVYTWVNDERALVLIAAHRPGSSWYVVCESAAFRYDDDQYLQRAAINACDVLGFEASPMTWVRIATILHEGLPDLITMPGYQPPPPGRKYGELTVKEDGKVIGGEDLRVESGGVTYA